MSKTSFTGRTPLWDAIFPLYDALSAGAKLALQSLVKDTERSLKQESTHAAELLKSTLCKTAENGRIILAEGVYKTLVLIIGASSKSARISTDVLVSPFGDGELFPASSSSAPIASPSQVNSMQAKKIEVVTALFNKLEREPREVLMVLILSNPDPRSVEEGAQHYDALRIFKGYESILRDHIDMLDTVTQCFNTLSPDAKKTLGCMLYFPPHVQRILPRRMGTFQELQATGFFEEVAVDDHSIYRLRSDLEKHLTLLHEEGVTQEKASPQNTAPYLLPNYFYYRENEIDAMRGNYLQELPSGKHSRESCIMHLRIPRAITQKNRMLITCTSVYHADELMGMLGRRVSDVIEKCELFEEDSGLGVLEITGNITIILASLRFQDPDYTVLTPSERPLYLLKALCSEGPLDPLLLRGSKDYLIAEATYNSALVCLATSRHPEDVFATVAQSR